MPLNACPDCACHVREGACTCPHCGATLKVCQRGAVTTAAAALMGLATLSSGCIIPQPKYGMPDTLIVDSQASDADGDGFSVADGDCDDEDASVNPGAEETAGDGVDSNCDGADDT